MTVMRIAYKEIAHSEFLPSGTAGARLYATGGASESELTEHASLTLPQLVAAVCLRAGAVYERGSVALANKMFSGSDELSELASECRAIMSGSGDIMKRLAQADEKKRAMESLERIMHEDEIELKALVNRRDLTFTTAVNTVRSVVGSQENVAGNL